jgi:hypothetical protein
MKDVDYQIFFSRVKSVTSFPFFTCIRHINVLQWGQQNEPLPPINIELFSTSTHEESSHTPWIFHLPRILCM